MLKVSVVVTVFNGAKYLASQLTSIKDQVSPADEIIVADDGSEDDSKLIVHGVFAGTRQRVVLLETTERPLGLNGNISRCIKASTGDVIVFADQDDVWELDKLKTIRGVFGVVNPPTVAFSDAVLCDRNGHPTGRTLWQAVGFTSRAKRRWQRDPLSLLLRRTVVTGATMAVSREAAQSALPIPVGAWHDAWITLQAVLRDEQPRAIDRRLMKYRVHGSNLAGLPAARLSDRISRAGWPDADAVCVWQEALSRAPQTDGTRRLRLAVRFHQQRLLKDRPVRHLIKGVVTLRYWKFGRGTEMVIHDLLALRRNQG